MAYFVGQALRLPGLRWVSFDRPMAAGAAPAAEGLAVDVHAAMTVVCSIILNLDEVLCRP